MSERRSQQKDRSGVQSQGRGRGNRGGKRGGDSGRGHGRGTGRLEPGHTDHPTRNQRADNPAMRILSIKEVGVSEGVKEFWRRIHRECSRGSLRESIFKVTDRAECDLWMQCWIAADAGINGCEFPVLSLFQVYTALPANHNIHPPHGNVVKTILWVSKELESTALQDSESAEKIFDAIYQVVERRLRSPHALQKLRSNPEIIPDLLSSIDDISLSIRSTLMQLQLKAQRDVRQKFADLFGLCDNSLSSYKRDLQDRSDLPPVVDSQQLVDNQVERIPVWLIWVKEPTVGWLMAGEWLKDVPSLKERYTGVQEYVETLLRTWTALTFYWGAAAVWPRCRHKVFRNGEEGACDEPLLSYGAVPTSCSEEIQRNSVRCPCPNGRSWSCSFRHMGVCTTCLPKLQNRIIGPGSAQGGRPTGASTDIYDAIIVREEVRKEGVVLHFTHLKSRKPPRKDPNWRTTYRLQNAALVAVVKLSVANETLKREQTIYWGEIVPSAPSRGKPSVPEHKLREQNKIAIRLLGDEDVFGLSGHDRQHELVVQTHVAIIDLQVFVPEVISVLSAYANPEFVDHLTKIPFAKRLVGLESSPPSWQPSKEQPYEIRTCVRNAVLTSEIPAIKRLSFEDKTQIIEEIASLQPIQSLYGTQLNAFVAGLTTSLHCTQGPPGTGKVSRLCWILNF